MSHVEPTTPPAAQRRAPDGLDAFFFLADEWSLTTDQQIKLLGGPARSTFFKWKKNERGGPLWPETQERISHLLSIYKALRILFTDPAHANDWIKRSNKFFDNKSALDVMLEGRLSDIYAVRTYIDAQRGG